jgi:Predicted permeases
MDPKYSLVGLLVGFLVGMTGMGGGSLMTPILILLVGIKPTVAVGSDLAYAAITKLVGGWLHRKAGFVDLGLAMRMALGSVPASILGVWALHHFQGLYGEAVQVFVKHALGGMLLLVAAAMLARSTNVIKQVNIPGRARWRREGYFWPVLIGTLLGFVVGVTSVGSGTLFGVAMLLIFGMNAHRMVGTDIVHAAMLTFAAAAAHVWAGNVDYSLVGSLLVGSIPGVLMGSRLATVMPQKALRPTLAVVLLMSGYQMVK